MWKYDFYLAKKTTQNIFNYEYTNIKLVVVPVLTGNFWNPVGQYFGDP